MRNTVRDAIRFAIGATLTLSVALSAAACNPRYNYPTTTTHCTEDMNCWNCNTMGNHICGRTGK